MRPPICAICGSRFPASEGGLVRFADYEPLPDGRVGHPEGLEWFCGKHHAAAEALSDRSSAEALRRLRTPLGYASRLGTMAAAVLRRLWMSTHRS